MKTIKDIILKSTRWLNLIERTYEDKNGTEQKWVMAQRNNCCSAVMIIPIHIDEHGEKRIVVTKEYRVPLGDYEWGFPAGLIDNNESVITTAIRELKEETGLDYENVIKISPSVYNTAGMTDEAITMVWLKCSGTISNEFQEANENIETFLMTVKDVDNLLADAYEEPDNYKFGAKAWLILDNFIEENIDQFKLKI